MQITLENEHYSVNINTLGAELTSFIRKSDNHQFIWQGHPDYWSGHSPVLFPVIGVLNHDEILIKGQKYRIDKHGFARKAEFTIIEPSATSVLFRLTQTPDSLIQYPYDFILDLNYRLDNNKLSIYYTVTNPNSEILPFQLGTHPAFRLAIDDSIQPPLNQYVNDWQIEFEYPETLSTCPVINDLIDIYHPLPLTENSPLLPLQADYFENNSLVFKQIRSRSLRLTSKHSTNPITVDFCNLPNLVLWQDNDCPFLCIEPWYGHGDVVGFEGDILSKIDMVHLPAGQQFQAMLGIMV